MTDEQVITVSIELSDAENAATKALVAAIMETFHTFIATLPPATQDQAKAQLVPNLISRANVLLLNGLSSIEAAGAVSLGEWRSGMVLTQHTISAIFDEHGVERVNN